MLNISEIEKENNIILVNIFRQSFVKKYNIKLIIPIKNKIFAIRRYSSSQYIHFIELNIKNTSPIKAIKIIEYFVLEFIRS